MNAALRSAAVHVAKRFLFGAVAIAAAVAFVSIAGGTDAQTSQQVAVIPVPVSPSGSTSAVVTTASIEIAEAPPSAPQLASPARSTAKKANPPTPTANVVTTAATRTSATRQRESRSTASTVAVPVYHYTAYRDVAAQINSARAAQGWPAVTTTALKSDAACLAGGTCTGQIGPCGMTPTSIGTATSTKISDGQYKDQYGNCREVIVI